MNFETFAVKTSQTFNTNNVKLASCFCRNLFFKFFLIERSSAKSFVKFITEVTSIIPLTIR